MRHALNLKGSDQSTALLYLIIPNRTPVTGQATTITALGKTFAEPSEPCRAKTQTSDASQTKMKKPLVDTAPQIPARIIPSGVIANAITPSINNQAPSFGWSASSAPTASSVGHCMTRAQADPY
jgi:hypothetical protein